MRVLLVHNPQAGDDDCAGEHLVELVNGSGHDVDYVQSIDSWKPRFDDSPELIAVAGGDGTVAEAARVAAARGIPITVLPAGTANNIAGSLGLSRVAHADLVAGWADGTLRPFDLGVAVGPWGGRTFFESVGIGALADLMVEIDHGGSGYVNELDAREHRLEAALGILQRIVGGSPGVTCELVIDGKPVAGDYLLVEVLNFGAAGPNLHLAPDADGGDGRLDVVLVGAADRSALTRHLNDSSAEPPLSGLWQVHHGRRILIRYRAAALHIDDEVYPSDEQSREIALEIEPSALNFLIPKISPP